MQQRHERNGMGDIMMQKQKKLNSHERTIIAIYATKLMGWQHDLTTWVKDGIALSA
jgi:hypothetical protein